MRRRAIGIVLAVVIGTSAAAQANQPDFQTWLDGVRSEAVGLGISQATIDIALNGVQPVSEILNRDRSQSSGSKPTITQYVDRVVTTKRVGKGREAAGRSGSVLDRVEARYGVQKRFLLAIWGLESNYGSYTGKHPVIPAIATLAYDPRRGDFFRGQLIDILHMLERGYIDVGSLKGSWAGAMGQPQFMPSSYLAYAQDFDGDGRRDIWQTEADVFASIANYLSGHGWSDKWTWGREVKLPRNFSGKLASVMPANPQGCNAEKQLSNPYKLSYWSSLGITRHDGGPLPTADLDARLVLPDGPGGRAFLVYPNYLSLLRYNCSHLYAISVGTLADRLWGY